MQVDLLKRAEKGSALNIAEHDENLTKVESRLNYVLDKTFTVINKDTNPILSVVSHGISFVYSGSKVLEVVFDKPYSDYITQLLINQKYNGYKLVLTKKNSPTQTFATVKEFAYTDQTNTHIKAIIAETIEHSIFVADDVVSCHIDFVLDRYSVKQIDTNIDEDVKLGEVHLQHNATDIIKVVFDLHASSYIGGYSDALANGKGLHLHVFNKTRAYTGTAKVTQIQSAGDSLFAVSVESGIDKDEFLLGHELEFRFDVNDAPGGNIPLEHEIVGNRFSASISGNVLLDLNGFSYFVLTLTAATTLSDTNRPTGNDVKIITVKVTGDFPLTLDANYTLIGDTYDGTTWNLLTIHFGNGTSGSEDIICDIRNI